MKEERKCQIVQDLLPNYIENLTNEETNKYIEEHLLQCEECRKVLDNMKKDIEINNDIKKEKPKVRYIKKYSKKLRIFEVSTFILLLVVLGVFVYYTFFWRNAYIDAANHLVDTVSSLENANAFYAKIEKIEDMSDLPVFEGDKTITVKGLDINGSEFREEFYFDILVNTDNHDVVENAKIVHNGKEIKLDELKVGQTVVVYNYKGMATSDNTDPHYLVSVRKIEVIDDEL